MQEIEAYRDELELIFAETAAELNGYPAGLGVLGRQLLMRSHPLRNGGGANVISYLLPYWIGEQTDAPIPVCRDLAIGNIFAMLRYFLLDDAMDEAGGDSGQIRGFLVLGQLLEESFRQRYQRHFPHDSLLWACYRRYVGEWASAVYDEMESPIDPLDFKRRAGKAAPVKLCASGLCLYSQRQDRIPDAEEAVDLALAVLQLSDDWDDWQDDLAAPNGNAFLSLARSLLSLPAEEALVDRAVRHAIYHRHAVRRLAEIAEHEVERLRQRPYPPERLVSFAHAVADGIRRHAEHIEQSTRALAAEGGFAHILYKLNEI